MSNDKHAHFAPEGVAKSFGDVYSFLGISQPKYYDETLTVLKYYDIKLIILSYTIRE